MLAGSLQPGELPALRLRLILVRQHYVTSVALRRVKRTAKNLLIVTRDVRVEIDVLQFERGPDSRVLLSAQWRIISAAGGTAVTARISDLYSEPLAVDATLATTVSTMSELMAQLSREIAMAIITGTEQT